MNLRSVYFSVVLSVKKITRRFTENPQSNKEYAIFCE